MMATKFYLRPHVYLSQDMMENSFCGHLRKSKSWATWLRECLRFSTCKIDMITVALEDSGTDRHV